MQLINFCKNLFQEKKPFKLGGHRVLEINDTVDGFTAKITYRMPTGDEMIQYLHAQLQDDKSELKKFNTELSSYDIHSNIRLKKFIPFAEKIIIDVDGYVNDKGKPTKDIGLIKEYKPQHLELLCSVAYVSNETFKKKS